MVVTCKLCLLTNVIPMCLLKHTCSKYCKRTNRLFRLIQQLDWHAVHPALLQADEVLGISSSIHKAEDLIALDDNLLRVVGAAMMALPGCLAAQHCNTSVSWMQLVIGSM